MTAQSIQRSNSPRTAAPGMPRKLTVAVTTAAIPAVMLSALALAEPAQAAPATPSTTLFPQLPLQAIKNLTAASGVIAPSQLAAQIPVTIASESSVPQTHRIVAGDTVSSIAARYGLDLNDVLSANNLESNSLIFAGKELRLTGGAAAAAPAAQSAGYTVQAGDTLSAIAAAHGVSLDSVLSANGLTLASVIQPGQQISLSGGSAVTTLSSAPAQSAPVEAAPVDLVPNTFLHYTYPDHVVADANINKQSLNNSTVPSRTQMQQIVAETAVQMGVDPALAMAFSFQESGFDQRAVSPANAIGAMQVIPSSGEWASDLVGRELNLLDPYDNATAGVAIIRSLIRTTDNLETAVASYYQGQYSVTTQGMYEDTRGYVASVLAHRQSFS